MLILRCIIEEEVNIILAEAHRSICENDVEGVTLTSKFLRDKTKFHLPIIFSLYTKDNNQILNYLLKKV